MEAKFYKAVLQPMTEEELNTELKGMSLSERIEDDGKCPECEYKQWWLLPKECVAVEEGGKQYIECLICGFSTHL